MAKRYDIKIEQGALYTRTVAVQNSDGTARNLTGFSAKMHFRRFKGDATALLSLVTGSGITINGPLGLVTFTISTAQTTAITWATGVYDLKIIDGSSEGERILEGNASVSVQVSV